MGQRRFAAAMGVPPPPGLAAFLAAHDGGMLSPDAQAADDGRGDGARQAARRHTARAFGGARWPAGLWPVVDRGGRRYALDAEEASGDGEWPVVEVTEHGVDRVGTSFLRFLHVLCAELAAGSVAGAAAIELAETRSQPRPGARRSLARPGGAAGDRGPRDRDRRDAGGRAARGDAADAGADARDRDARRARKAQATGRRASTPRSRRCARSRTRSRWSRWARATTTRGWTPPRWCSCWPPSAATRWARRTRARCWASRRRRRPRSGAARRWRRWPKTAGAPVSPVGALALRIVAMLEPDDRDLPRLQAPTAELRAACGGCRKAREALEAGQVEAAVRSARAAMAMPELAAARAPRRRSWPRR